MSSPSISLCMIVKDEESMLSRCLSSAKDLVDEMIIVDTGSSDNTVNIAQEYGAKIFHFQWINDFAAARNFGLEHASCDYILHLDADEEIASDNIQNIRNILLSGKTAYSLQVENFGQQKLSPAFRIWRNQKNIRFKGSIHEHPFLDDDATFGGSYQFTDIKIIHYGYTSDVFTSRSKSERNKKYVLAALRDDPNNENYFYYLAVCHYSDHNSEKAVRILLKFVKRTGGRMFGRTAMLLINMLIELERYSEALDVAMKATEQHRELTDLFYTIGTLSQRLGDLQKAESAFLRSIDIGQSPPSYVSDPRTGLFLPAIRLALIYGQVGLKDKAIEYFEKALRAEPGDLQARDAFLNYLKIVSPGDAQLTYDSYISKITGTKT